MSFLPPTTPAGPGTARSTVLYDLLDTPVGTLLLTTDTGADLALTGLHFPDAGGEHVVARAWRRDPRAVQLAASQLQEYFAGQRRTFEVPLLMRGTPFQHRVWESLLEIEYGSTWSYGQLARHLGAPSAARAVGLANGQNPVSILVPCHRVIGASGALVGYGGGLPRKVALLQLERAHAGLPPVPGALF